MVIGAVNCRVNHEILNVKNHEQKSYQHHETHHQQRCSKKNAGEDAIFIKIVLSREIFPVRRAVRVNSLRHPNNNADCKEYDALHSESFSCDYDQKEEEDMKCKKAYYPLLFPVDSR